jgi:hypothetical protein
MNSLIILTTTEAKYSLRMIVQSKRAGHPIEDAYIRLVLDAFDILRVIEVKVDDSHTSPICTVSYALEHHVKDGDENITMQVRHIDVRHSLDEIYELVNNARREKEGWQQ